MRLLNCNKNTKREASEVSFLTLWWELQVWFLEAAGLLFSATSKGTGHGVDAKSSEQAGVSNSRKESPGPCCRCPPKESAAACYDLSDLWPLLLC